MQNKTNKQKTENMFEKKRTTPVVGEAKVIDTKPEGT